EYSSDFLRAPFRCYPLRGGLVSRPASQMRGAYEAICTAHGRVAAFGRQSTNVDTSTSPLFTVDGPIGPHRVSPIAADLLDIASVIYRCERQLPKRAPSNPNVKFELTMPV